MLRTAATRANDRHDQMMIEHALGIVSDPDVPANAKHGVVLGKQLHQAIERDQERAGAVAVPSRCGSRSTGVRAQFGAWYELFPRSWGGLKGVQAQLPRFAELGFDVLYLPPIHPIGLTNRKGANNALVAAPGDPGSPWAIGDAGGGHDAVHAGARDDRGSARPHGCRGGARHRHRAGLRGPVLGRPSVAQRASRVVSPSARRHAQVRREPAQALPGHLQRQLGLPGLAQAVERAAGDRADVGRLRRQGVPGRQPAHQAVPVLGVADRAGARPRP